MYPTWSDTYFVELLLTMLNKCVAHTTPNFWFDECMFSKSVTRFINVDPVLFIDETIVLL